MCSSMAQQDSVGDKLAVMNMDIRDWCVIANTCETGH